MHPRRSPEAGRQQDMAQGRLFLCTPLPCHPHPFLRRPTVARLMSAHPPSPALPSTAAKQIPRMSCLRPS